ncbi:phosphomutase PMU1 [Ceratobasidium sp. AG-Ba]|nr:phosphomutase PMU1 [Ceratobasidium sp. AG-Ba]
MDITFKDVIPQGDNITKPRVLENLREQLAPYTSEHRSTKAQIQATYPAFDIEEGFTEEDQLWGENFSELDPKFSTRIRSTLDKIFGTILESSDTYVSITCHSGVAAAILRIIGHRNFPLSAGGVIPVVIKVT